MRVSSLTGSTLPPCAAARVSICTLLPRPAPPRQTRRGERHFARRQEDSHPLPLARRSLGQPPTDCRPGLGANCTSEAMYERHRALGGEAGVKNPLRDAERSKAAHLIPGGEGAIAGGGPVPARAQGRREEAYSLYAATTGGPSTRRDGPSSRDCAWRGACTATIMPRRNGAFRQRRAESRPASTLNQRRQVIQQEAEHEQRAGAAREPEGRCDVPERPDRIAGRRLRGLGLRVDLQHLHE